MQYFMAYTTTCVTRHNILILFRARPFLWEKTKKEMCHAAIVFFLLNGGVNLLLVAVRGRLTCEKDTPADSTGALESIRGRSGT